MTIIETSIFYVLVVAFALLLCWQSEATGKRWGVVACVLLLSLVAGLRAYTVGVDTLLYKNGVDYFFFHNKVSWQYSFAYGYGVFSKAILTLCNSYSFLLFVEALLTNGLIIARFWDFRKEGSITFMVLVYLCTMYLMTLCIIVQHIAVAITFYCSRFLDRNRPVLYCIGVALASCLHISALIAVVPLVLRVRFRNVTPLRALVQLAFLTMLPGFAMFAAEQMLGRYAVYDSAARQSSAGLMVFVQAGVFAATLLACGYFSRANRKNGELSLKRELKEGAPYAVFLYVLALLLSAASYVINNAGRIAYYFTPYGALCYGIVAKGAGRSKTRFLCSILLVEWFVMYAVYTFFMHDGLGIFPYAFFWV